MVKIRYQAPFVPATLMPVQGEAGSDALAVHFHEPQRAVTPGQAVVFYIGGQVVGGGRIRSALR